MWLQPDVQAMEAVFSPCCQCRCQHVEYAVLEFGPLVKKISQTGEETAQVSWQGI